LKLRGEEKEGGRKDEGDNREIGGERKKES
jgi:hypothetical protein